MIREDVKSLASYQQVAQLRTGLFLREPFLVRYPPSYRSAPERPNEECQRLVPLFLNRLFQIPVRNLCKHASPERGRRVYEETETFIPIRVRNCYSVYNLLSHPPEFYVVLRPLADRFQIHSCCDALCPFLLIC